MPQTLPNGSIQTVCFDLDGTLVDTAPDLLAALDFCLAQKGYPLPDHDLIRPIIGQGAKEMIRRSVSLEPMGAADGLATQAPPCPLSEEEIDDLWQVLIAYYAKHIAVKSAPFEGVVEALGALKQRGFLLAVCTNKPLYLTAPLLDQLNLTFYFDAISGADSFPYRKPDPRHLLDTITQAGGDRVTSVMVGDSKTDIDTARNANVPVIGVDFGYSEVTMESLKPDRMMSHYDELIDLIVGLG